MVKGLRNINMKISDLIKELEEIKNKHGNLELVRFRNNESNLVDNFISMPDVVGVVENETSWGGTETMVVTYDMNMKYDHLCVLMN